MKELSIQEKAKRYDEAIKYGQYLINERCKEGTDGSFHRADLQKMFPELAESEDEKIKNVAIEFVKQNNSFNYRLGISKEEVIAWIKKQGEQKSEEVYNLHNYLYGKQKPADKVEPKFHEDDWIVHHGTENIYQVVAIIDNQYQLKYGDNYTVQNCADVDRCARLWNITEDAKDGDVLVDSLGNVCIYQEPSTKLMYHSYCYGNHKCFIDMGGSHVIVGSSPATNEQHDLLFQKMKEAGYEWNAEKKELNKIEQKPAAWSEEDEINLEKAIWYVENPAPMVVKDSMLVEWLKNIRGRVQPQPKVGWSEEDEQMIGRIRGIVEKYAFSQSAVDVNGDLCEKEYIEADNWLKSLIPQNH